MWLTLESLDLPLHEVEEESLVQLDVVVDGAEVALLLVFLKSTSHSQWVFKTYRGRYSSSRLHAYSFADPCIFSKAVIHNLVKRFDVAQGKR